MGVYKKLVVYDGRRIPFPNNSFLTVVSNSVLEHIEDLNMVLKEIHRVLRRDGVFLTTVMAKSWEENLFGAKLLGSFYKRWMKKKQIHLNLFTKKGWDERFKRANFKIVKTIGYLTPSACSLIDVLHYISVPSLITYKLFSRWVIFPKLTEFYPVRYFTKIISPNLKPEEAGALFYALQK